MAQVGADAKPHIRQAMMNDEVVVCGGAASLASRRSTVCATRVEAAQEGMDEAMRQALAASSAKNVKPRVEVSREDST